MAGKFSLATGTHTYTTTSVDAAWFDTSTSSSDGPAAVLRIVIDVSGVSGADTSSMLGSVYYSTSGPAAGGDIKVADMTFKVAHAFADSGSVSTTGSFYVNG